VLKSFRISEFQGYNVSEHGIWDLKFGAWILKPETLKPETRNHLLPLLKK
jgi:hypothetical protein